MPSFSIEPLSSAHKRDDFDCGVEDLNIFLKQYASQNQKKHFVRTYVGLKDSKIIGYYSLAFGEIRRESAPDFVIRGAGKYKVPAIIIGRLAVAKNEQGKKIGQGLLKDAILRSKKAEQIAGLRVIVVHAKDDNARMFYKKYGFIESKDDALTLVFPIEFISE
jgi:predicted GNAT family N-acyltransferase